MNFNAKLPTILYDIKILHYNQITKLFYRNSVGIAYKIKN